MGRVAKNSLLTVRDLWHIRRVTEVRRRERKSCRDERDCQAASRARRASETHAVPLRARRALRRIGNPTMLCTGRDAAAPSAAMLATANMSRSCSPIVSTGCGSANSGEAQKRQMAKSAVPTLADRLRAAQEARQAQLQRANKLPEPLEKMIDIVLAHKPSLRQRLRRNGNGKLGKCAPHPHHHPAKSSKPPSETPTRRQYLTVAPRSGGDKGK